MDRAGLTEGTAGNLSARTRTGQVVLTPTALRYATMTLDDLVVTDLDGRILVGLAPADDRARPPPRLPAAPPRHRRRRPHPPRPRLDVRRLPAADPVRDRGARALRRRRRPRHGLSPNRDGSARRRRRRPAPRPRGGARRESTGSSSWRGPPARRSSSRSSSSGRRRSWRGQRGSGPPMALPDAIRAEFRAAYLGGVDARPRRRFESTHAVERAPFPRTAC